MSEKFIEPVSRTIAVDDKITNLLADLVVVGDKHVTFAVDIEKTIKKLRDEFSWQTTYRDIAVPQLMITALLSAIEEERKELKKLMPKGGVANIDNAVIGEEDQTDSKDDGEGHIDLTLDESNEPTFKEMLDKEIDKQIQKYLEERTTK